jgi:hypothetical protein
VKEGSFGKKSPTLIHPLPLSVVGVSNKEEEGLSVGICSLAQSAEKIYSSWVVRSCLISSIEDCMVVLMATTLALSCFTSFWVSMRPDCKVLKRASKSWLQVWAMRMGELKRGRWGQKFCRKIIWMKVIRAKR